MKFNLFVGASTGPEVEDRWAKLDMIDRRYPHQVGATLCLLSPSPLLLMTDPLRVKLIRWARTSQRSGLFLALVFCCIC
jgi:hypothetical protein